MSRPLASLASAAFLVLITIAPGFAGPRDLALFGFRWGEAADDSVLVGKARVTSEGEFRLMPDNIRAAVEFDASKGWRKNSGSGIYFSHDPVDSFGTGRYELFIFRLTGPQNSGFPVDVGPLGDSVRDYYLKDGLPPPMVSRYTDSWYVIARAPSDEEYGSGLKIVFHRATPDDAEPVIQVLKARWQPAEAHANLERILKMIDLRVNRDHVPSPADTLGFLRSFAEQLIEFFPEDFAVPGGTLSSLRTDLLRTLGSRIDASCASPYLKDALPKS